MNSDIKGLSHRNGMHLFSVITLIVTSNYPTKFCWNARPLSHSQTTLINIHTNTIFLMEKVVKSLHTIRREGFSVMMWTVVVIHFMSTSITNLFTFPIINAHSRCRQFCTWFPKQTRHRNQNSDASHPNPLFHPLKHSMKCITAGSSFIFGFVNSLPYFYGFFSSTISLIWVYNGRDGIKTTAISLCHSLLRKRCPHNSF